jgi:FAD binding domain
VTDVDVLVIGGGPSGLTVAAEVARTGASVLVLERREVEPIPRAGTVLPRPLELFDARGIAEQFIRRTSEVNPNPYQNFHIWAGMAPVSWAARESRFGFTLILAQHETEEVLRRWAVDCGAELRFRHEMVGVHDNGDKVTAVVRDQHGVTSSVEARYVVGATKPEVTEHLWAELNGLQTQYPQPDERLPPVGFPAPDFEMFLLDGSTTRLYELLRQHAFVVVDLSGTKTLRGLEPPNDAAAVIEAHPIRRPIALRGVSALIVRPDTYVAWATTSTPNPEVVSAELARILSIGQP